MPRRRGTTRPRGFAPWSHKPDGRHQECLDGALEVLEEYSEFLPLTVRQIYYRLVAKGVVGEKIQDYWLVANVLVDARRAQIIDFDDIRDDKTICAQPPYSYRDADDFVRVYTPRPEQFTYSLLTKQPYYIEIVCEAAGMVGQLAEVARPLGIRVTGSAGFDSVTSKYSLAQRLIEEGTERETVPPCIVLHLGDLDVSGGHIRNALKEDIDEFGADAQVVPVAVLPEHITYGLPTQPKRKPSDADIVQLEALEPSQIQEILRAAIAEYWDEDAETEMREWVEEQKAEIADYVERLEEWRNGDDE